MVQMHPNCQLLGTRPRRRECLPPLASLPKAKHAHRATGAISSLAGLPVRSQYRFGPHRAALIQREYLTRQYQPSSLCSCQKYIPKTACSTTVFHRFMQSTQTIVTRLVKNYLNKSGTTQKTLAAALGITQPTLSRKLTGIRTWSLDDLDQLIQLGISVHSRVR